MWKSQMLNLRMFVNQICRRRNYLVIALLVITALVIMNSSKSNHEIEDDLSVNIVVLSQRGILSNKASHGVYGYSETNNLRLKTIGHNGVLTAPQAGKIGLVNVHIWFGLCGTDILTLKRFPSFPNVPSERKLLPGLEIKNMRQNYGKRLFGFLVGPEDGSFSFRLESSGSAEFWLSSDDKLQNSVCLVSKKEDERTSISSAVKFIKSKLYYFEILHKHGAHQKRDSFVLEWKNMAAEKNYGPILGGNLRSYQDDLEIPGDAVSVQSFPPVGLKIHENNDGPKTATSSLVSREEIYKLPFIPEEVTKDLFSECEYKPDYLINYKLDRYGSKFENVYPSLYPSDNTNLTDAYGFVYFGNDVLEKEKALSIVDRVLRQFRKKGLRNYSLENIINIELKQGRYLVEIQLLDSKTKKSERFSEYLYLPRGSSELCYPAGFKWNKNSMVHFLVTSGRNQGRWVYHLIQNMEKIYKETRDHNFNLVINDFLCPDADLKQALENSSLPNYLYLTNTGNFHKTLGLAQAANAVTDPNGIIAVLDLHLDLPSSYVDDIRKHTVKGLQVYSPVLTRMECGTNAAVDMGSYWEFHGYGLVGIYKQDWDKFGGMNVKEFKHKWGGEDIEMMDRILMAGFEADRKKIKGLVHYYHPKHGMWNKS